MSALLDVTLPVFLVIGFGYLAVFTKLFSAQGVQFLMHFAQSFAIPCLLFKAIWLLDLTTAFDARLLGSYYTGSLISFTVGLLGARILFKRGWPDAVVIGFCCLFANSVLLGLPITERAFGEEALAPNYAIVSLHAPFAYILGTTAMEIARAKGVGVKALAGTAYQIAVNPLMAGIGLGFVANLVNLKLPDFAVQGLDLMIVAALPVALFGLGGVLAAYRPEGDLKVVLFICGVSLALHPLIVLGMSDYVTDLSDGQRRSAILTAAMAPGVNGYIFASLYGVALRVSASAVLVGTACSIVSVSLWLQILS